VAGNRRQGGGGAGGAGTKFQDLQDMAAAAAAAAQPSGGDTAAGLDELTKLLGDQFKDPEVVKQYEAAMAELSKMSPEQLQEQMAQAMNLMQGGDMVQEILKQKDAVIASLEQTGGVPAEDLARMKRDDAFFELKMRESLDQMQEIFADPEYFKVAAEAMHNVAEVMTNPDKAFESLASLLGEFANDNGKIEEARLEFLEGTYNPTMGDIFQSEDMQGIILDPVKWRNAVKEGYQAILAGNDAIGGKDEL
jgi:hypothetical protein